MKTPSGATVTFIVFCLNAFHGAKGDLAKETVTVAVIVGLMAVFRMFRLDDDQRPLREKAGATAER